MSLSQASLCCRPSCARGLFGSADEHGVSREAERAGEVLPSRDQSKAVIMLFEIVNCNGLSPLSGWLSVADVVGDGCV